MNVLFYRGNSSRAHVSSQKHLAITGEKAHLATPLNINATVFSEDVSNLKTSILPNFNASKPNFYMELNSNAKDNNSVQKTDNFLQTADSDEDYDT